MRQHLIASECTPRFTYRIAVRCPFCGKRYHVDGVRRDLFVRWYNGDGNIQDLLPDLSADSREALLTGICSDCFPTDED